MLPSGREPEFTSKKIENTKDILEPSHKIPLPIVISVKIESTKDTYGFTLKYLLN